MAATARDIVMNRHQERQQTKEGLSSWWSRFKARPNKKEPSPPKGIFGVALQESIQYANVAISLYNDNGQPFIYGYIPIVVAKCGLFLKEEATETEGIFRVSGSAKRIKELQDIFDTPPKYGKGLDWRATGFTVHDAANILRRYLNQLPEPIVPTEWYDDFREPLKREWPLEQAIARMQHLVASLPPLNRQLLLYILDLLAVFASKSEVNRMTSENLSAIFQPGILTHPRDVMTPQAYRLSQEVLVFLIDNQGHFLLDMCQPTELAAPVSAVTTTNTNKSGSITRRRTVASRRTTDQSPQPEHAPAALTPVDLSSLQIPPRGTTPISRGSSNAANLSRSNTVPTKRSAQSPPMGYGQPPTHTGTANARAVSTPTMLSETQNASHVKRVPIALEDKPIDESLETEMPSPPQETISIQSPTSVAEQNEVRAQEALDAVSAAKPDGATGSSPTMALPIPVSIPVVAPAQGAPNAAVSEPLAIPGAGRKPDDSSRVYQTRSPAHSRTSLHAIQQDTVLTGARSPRSITPRSLQRIGSRRTSQASSAAMANDHAAATAPGVGEFSVLGGRKLSASELPHAVLIPSTTPGTQASLMGTSPSQSLPSSSLASAKDRASAGHQQHAMSSSPSRLSNLFRRARNAHSNRHDRESVSSTSESAVRRDLDK